MFNWLKQVISPTSPPATTAAQILQAAPKASISEAGPALAVAEESPETAFRFAKLIMVTAQNNNKFYEMQENADATFTVRYGRVGGGAATVSYPISEWESKRREKLRKGYADQTHLFAESAGSDAFDDIEDAAVRKLMDELTACSRESLLRNYNVAASQVTRRQVERAQELLDGLVKKVKKKMDPEVFNADLLELFKIIPRKMKQVKEHLIEAPASKDDLLSIEKMLAHEQATLDVMRAEVETLENQKAQAGERSLNLLQAMGLHIEEVKDSDLTKHIKKMMGDQKDRFARAFKVTNFRTQQSFDQHLETAQNKRVELFWHGSRNENWLSIMKTGLVLRPANAVITGKMFGYGLYFADKSQKSLNYSSLRGSYWSGGSSHRAWLALYDVHLGKPLNISRHDSWCSQLTGENLRQRGADYDSVFAKGGADLINNEYIVYDQSQCTVRYLVEVHA